MANLEMNSNQNGFPGSHKKNRIIKLLAQMATQKAFTAISQWPTLNRLKSHSIQSQNYKIESCKLVLVTEMSVLCTRFGFDPHY